MSDDPVVRPAHDPPDWALPSWDAIDAGPGRRERDEPHPQPRVRPGGTFGLRTYTVSEVTRAIREVVRSDGRLADVWVEGEVGRVTISSAGHAYFSLKDERNQLQCMWFRDVRMMSAFEAQAGLRVVAHGRIDLYEPTGALQLYVDGLQPAGFGDLALRFEELKARLAAEGLFEAARKRRLPTRPTAVAVVTSPTGAVWHDICQVMARRWPQVRVVLSPCTVQGDAAPASIVRALRRVERWAAEQRSTGHADDAPTVTILARGGGSLEDLWPFNDERVVRAVVGHALPLVSGVGHETDVTLVDFAADARAPTPSAAAELVVPDQADARASIEADARRLHAVGARRLAGARSAVAAERRALERLGPAAQLASAREGAGRLLDAATRVVVGRVDGGRGIVERLDRRFEPTLPYRLERSRSALDRTARLLPLLGRRRLDAARTSVDAASAALAVLGPQATLDRGYAIVRREVDGRIVRDAADAPPGSRLRVRVARADLEATVERAVGDGPNRGPNAAILGPSTAADGGPGGRATR